jgi:ribonuclease G
LSNELVISSSQQGSRIALLQDRRLIEYHVESDSNSFIVGDIYLGIIRKLVPNLNAAFVDIGYEKDAFLHYNDLGPNIRSLNKYTKLSLEKQLLTHKLNDFQLEPETDKFGKIVDIFAKNQRVLVQVTKEPISTKGPRLSCEISIAGRYLVLVPFTNTVSISKKISNREERYRLQRLVTSIKPANFGVIVRTVASGKEVAELDKDLRSLVDKWEMGFRNLQNNAQPRDKIVGEMNRASSILRDMLNESFDSIMVDSKEEYEEIRDYVRNIAPDRERILKLYNGKTKAFESLGIEKQIKTLFGKSVSLPGGGYVIIEHTEALHVIDVNSGNKATAEGDQEATAFAVNIEAAKEIARQIRLRDMGGIIVIDFIDMKKADNKRLIYEQVREEMKSDRSKSTILPLSKFGLMQITRQRVRPEMNVMTSEICPTCGGTGKITASILVSDTIQSTLDYILIKQNEKRITLILHPYLYAYFLQGFPSQRLKWFFKYKRWIRIIKDSSIGVTDFKILNGLHEEIEVSS